MGKSLYFLIYKEDSRGAKLALREPTLDSKDFIRIGGKRASKLFRNIISVLDAYALKYSISRRNDEVVIELPADIGYALLLYLLLAYNSRNQEKYTFFLERLLVGKIPLSKYFDLFINMAIDLSDLKSSGRRRRSVIESATARTISSMMQVLVKNLPDLQK
jgi:hypothetical protein